MNPGYEHKPTACIPPHPVLLALHLSVLEGILGHSRHPPVLLDIVPHLQVTGVGHEVGVGCCRRLLELFQLKQGGECGCHNKISMNLFWRPEELLTL